MASRLEESVRKYLNDMRIMQLATVSKGRPWLCNLHYVSDDSLYLYWLSNTERRHSQELLKHPKVAAAIAVKFPKHPVVGIQIEGRARVVDDGSELSRVMELYDKGHGLSKEFSERIIKGRAKEKLYRLIPSLVVLFDEETYPDEPRQELNLKDER